MVLPPVSLWFRSLEQFPMAKRVLPTVRSGHAARAQRANSDSHFFDPVCGLLHAIACIRSQESTLEGSNPLG